MKPTLTNTLKSTSPISPYTLPKTQFFAKSFPPPSKALLSNGSQPSHLTLSTASTPSHTCSKLISLAAARIKLLQSPSSAFINRFSKAALRTPHLNLEMILQCMALTLQPGPFANNVYLHPPASMHELKLRATDYVRMEEMQTLHTKFCNDYNPTAANPTPPPPRPNQRPWEPRQPRFSRYVPLNVPRSRLLDEALQADLIPLPRKTTTPPNGYMTKYCRYHRNHGHTTEECKALQDKIEELVRVGHFRRFVRKDDHPPLSDHPPRFDHRRPLRDSRHDKCPSQLDNRDHQPARTNITSTHPPYAALLTPSLVALLVADPPHSPERDTSAIYNPSTTLPTPITNVACPP